MLLLALVAACSFGAGYAWSALRQADYAIIRVAYANGYKDGLQYAFRASAKELRLLQRDFDLFKSRVLLATDAYVAKVEELNR
ncbi:MAG: hypothetical protein D6682_05235 [Zetaproteobacteria bacterium]|nr:MAG: hypothetical protein D6682_05235 [Zetaproteobacteria bacterium]